MQYNYPMTFKALIQLSDINSTALLNHQCWSKIISSLFYALCLE